MQRTTQILAGAVLMIGLLAASEALAGITPVITASRCTTASEVCAPPLSVFFHARNTTCTTAECDNNPIANEAFHALHYEWNFGDSASASQTWVGSGQSRNVESGPLAIHVFDQKGTYTVTLTVRSGSETVSRTVNIVVDDPDVVWPPSATSCVNPVGDSDFSGCAFGGVGTNNVNDNSYNAALSRAFGTGDRRVLFKGGRSFTLSPSPSPTLPGDSGGVPGLVGSYGSGRASISSSGGAFIEAGGFGRSDWRFHNFDVDQGGTGGGLMLFNSSSQIPFTARNFLFYKVYQHDGFTGIQALAKQLGTAYGPPGLMVVDSQLSASDDNGYAFFGAAQGGGIVGTVISSGESDGKTHLMVRTQPAHRDFMIAHNHFKCFQTSGGQCADAPLTIRGNTLINESGASVASPGFVSDFLVVRGNRIDGNTGADVGMKPEVNGWGSYMRDSIIENNVFEVRAYWMAKSTTVRNNLTSSTLGPSTNNGCGMLPGWVSHSQIYNNSRRGAGPMVHLENHGGSCTGVMGGGHVVRNNLNPDGSPIWSEGSASFPDPVVSNNLVSGNFGGAGSPFAVNPPRSSSPADWRLQGPGASIAIDAGFNVGSMAKPDFEGRLRPQGSGFDVGAMEFGSGSATSPSPSPPPASQPEPPVLLP